MLPLASVEAGKALVGMPQLLIVAAAACMCTGVVLCHVSMLHRMPLQVVAPHGTRTAFHVLARPSRLCSGPCIYLAPNMHVEQKSKCMTRIFDCASSRKCSRVTCQQSTSLAPSLALTHKQCSSAI